MLTDENIMKTEPVNPENDAMDLQLDENESLQGADGSSKLSETEALKEALNEQKTNIYDCSLSLTIIKSGLLKKNGYHPKRISGINPGNITRFR